MDGDARADVVGEELVLALRNLAQEMLDDGDGYVEHYGQMLADLLRLVDGPA